MDNLAHAALAAAPPFPSPGRWTPLLFNLAERAAAAGDIANAIRLGAHFLTLEERSRLAVELLTPHSCDYAHDSRFNGVRHA
jgi:hypothetical protein